MAAEPRLGQDHRDEIDAGASTATVDEDVPEEVALLHAESTAQQAARRQFEEALKTTPLSQAEAAQRVETVLRYEAVRVYDRMSRDQENPLGPSAADGHRHDLLSDAVEQVETAGLEGLSETHWKHVPQPLRDRALRWTVLPAPTRAGTAQEQTVTSTSTKQGSERAMESVGKKTVQGNLTGDPRKVQTKAGQELVVMKVAENGRRFNQDSRAWEDTEAKFYDVAVDRELLGANVLASLRKGDRVTVTGDYRVGAYATSTGQPGLNHRIWAEDVAASMQYNPVAVLPRDHHRDGASLVSSPNQSVDRTADQGLQPEQLTPEAFATWSAQQPVTVPGAQQGVTGLTR